MNSKTINFIKRRHILHLIHMLNTRWIIIGFLVLSVEDGVHIVVSKCVKHANFLVGISVLHVIAIVAYLMSSYRMNYWTYILGLVMYVINILYILYIRESCSVILKISPSVLSINPMSCNQHMQKCHQEFLLSLF